MDQFCKRSLLKGHPELTMTHVGGRVVEYFRTRVTSLGGLAIVTPALMRDLGRTNPPRWELHQNTLRIAKGWGVRPYLWLR